MRALGDFRVPVSKLVEVVLHVGKGAKFGVEKVNSGQNICSRDASVGNGKNFEKQAQSSKGKAFFNIDNVRKNAYFH